MEVIRGTAHASFPLTEQSRLGEARRHATQLAREAGMDDVDAGRVALVATELATNLLRHAREGRLLVCRHEATVELIAIDQGPGIADLGRSLADGYSTGGTPGTGLGAVRRLADDFDITSSVPQGTVALARIHAGRVRRASGAHALCAGAVSLNAPGESVCGDAWCIAHDGERGSILLADGLGHGPMAAEASAAAVEVFAKDPFADCRTFVQQAHARLRATRGAALAVMHLDAAAGVVRYAGAGNVLGRLISGVSDRSLVTQHGTAGLTIRTVEPAQVEWPQHALLVAHTDGIESRWQAQTLVPLLQRDPTLAAAVLLRDHCRGRDDATVVVMRRKD
ncbi:ATP-binding protein [Ramlibacter sp. AN1015]|uniref:ATP-binding protein n=1 Tax=Ramlibacter sp. AN1015 TaxID=3133428 RepID=UPI0030C595F7